MKICQLLLLLMAFHHGASQPSGFYSFFVYPRSKGELRLFDNHYQEVSENPVNSAFNTLWLEGFYAPSHRYNLGFRLKARKVIKKENLRLGDLLKNYRGTVLNTYQRVGATAAHIVLRHHLAKTYGKWSCQHQLGIPLGKDLEGSQFIDWNGFTAQTQVFFTSVWRKHFLLFAEAGLMGENVQLQNFTANQTFFSYLSFHLSALPGIQLTANHFIYLLLQYTPRWAVTSASQWSFNPFGNFGLGYKYFIGQLELEIIASKFYQWFPNSQAWTLNLGLRYFY